LDPRRSLPRRLTVMSYAFHVRRKETGAWQTERAVHKGNPPKPDDVIDANLNGEMVKARVLVVITPPPSREGEGDPAVKVHATEI
jgi:hypothetical protein